VREKLIMMEARKNLIRHKIFGNVVFHLSSNTKMKTKKDALYLMLVKNIDFTRS
jgi:uncharacterized protein YbcI